MTAMLGSGTITMTSGSSEQMLSGLSSDRGVTLVIRANDPDVFIGESGFKGSLPASGFELTPGVEYTMNFGRIYQAIGNVAANSPYVATTSGGTVTVSYYFILGG